tara:strand:- start:155 stop:715 length:561 start_codon:yes stop_codon:yes gene_type:complete
MANIEPNFNEELVMPSGATRSMFEARVPGQSLTEDPGKHPYERPPQYTDPNEVMATYMSSLTNDEAIFNLFQMLEAKIPVSQIVSGMVLQGIGEGLFSPDVGLLVMEDLSLLILNVAEVAEIDYVTGYEQESEKMMLRLAKKADAGADFGEEQIAAGRQVVEAEMQKREGEEAPAGIMSKPMDIEE